MVPTYHSAVKSTTTRVSPVCPNSCSKSSSLVMDFTRLCVCVIIKHCCKQTIQCITLHLPPTLSVFVHHILPFLPFPLPYFSLIFPVLLPSSCLPPPLSPSYFFYSLQVNKHKNTIWCLYNCMTQACQLVVWIKSESLKGTVRIYT